PPPTLFPYTTLFRSHPVSPATSRPPRAVPPSDVAPRPRRRPPFASVSPALPGKGAVGEVRLPLPAPGRGLGGEVRLPLPAPGRRSEEHTSELQSPYD